MEKGKSFLPSRLHIEPDWNRIENKPTFPRPLLFLPSFVFFFRRTLLFPFFFFKRSSNSSNDGGRRSYIRELRDFYWRGSVWLHFASSEATKFFFFAPLFLEWESGDSGGLWTGETTIPYDGIRFVSIETILINSSGLSLSLSLSFFQVLEGWKVYPVNSISRLHTG